jgi:hypothetical protein
MSTHLRKKLVHEAVTALDVDSHVVRPDVIVVTLRL